MPSFAFRMPMKTVNELNEHDHWRARAKRAKTQRSWAATFTRSFAKGAQLPVIVTLTRISPGELDSHDNLRAAMKHVVDGIADVFRVADRDPRITWRYAQRKGERRLYAVDVCIESPEAAS